MTSQEQKSAIEYTAQVASSCVNGNAKLKISNNALTIATLFDAAEIAFANINALELADYAITIKTDSGDYILSRMGSSYQPFYDKLYDAYNKAVLRSLFIKGNPILTVKGSYCYTENSINGGGTTPVHVYENNVVTLPPNLSARRVPLCFVNNMDRDDFELTLKLNTGESYAYAKLGYETVVFAEAVEKQIRKLREESLAALKEIDPALTVVQALQLAKFIPHGAAAPIGQLAEIAPSFTAALESKINATYAADSYKIFKELCDPAQIWVGFKKNETAKENAADSLSNTMAGGLGDIIGNLTGKNNPLEALNGLTDSNTDGNDTKTPKQDPYLLWLIAPSQDGQFAAVEFAETNSATFVYRTGGDFNGFAKQLNRALEAINFKREVIRLTDVELSKPENADYYIASKRTAALQFVRSNFVSRVIHFSPEKWKNNLLSYFESKKEKELIIATSQEKICAFCGHTNKEDSKFCDGCGMQIEQAGITCPACNFVNSAGTKFCGNCGQPTSGVAALQTIATDIKLDKKSYPTGATIILSVTGITTEMQDYGAFVAMYKAGATNNEWSGYDYPQAGDSQLTLTAPDDSGNYEIRLYTHNSQYDNNAVCLKSIAFTVDTKQADTLICVTCGHNNPIGIKFCGECGALLSVIGHKYCVLCGTKLTIGTRFCSECGTRQTKE